MLAVFAGCDRLECLRLMHCDFMQEWVVDMAVVRRAPLFPQVEQKLLPASLSSAEPPRSVRMAPSISVSSRLCVTCGLGSG